MNLRKKLAFAVMALAIPSSWADIPESSVSSAAVFAVKKAWPRAGFIEWELSGSGKLYEAEFNINGFEFDVKVDPEGKILRVKEEIAVSALPGPVRAAALKPYPADPGGRYSLRGPLNGLNRLQPETGAALSGKNPGRAAFFLFGISSRPAGLDDARFSIAPGAAHALKRR